MTRNADRTTLTDRAADPAPGWAGQPARLSTGRPIGVDLARGLLVLPLYRPRALPLAESGWAPGA
ncbi:hypothetical protein [Streptomyces acidiscabies]|uniref:hypothetical protein n=1 Tax=Streptomyces acidiscabies TaxID=42234 RepID=UPI0038F6AE88